MKTACTGYGPVALLQIADVAPRFTARNLYNIFRRRSSTAVDG